MCVDSVRRKWQHFRHVSIYVLFKAGLHSVGGRENFHLAHAILIQVSFKDNPYFLLNKISLKSSYSGSQTPSSKSLLNLQITTESSQDDPDFPGPGRHICLGYSY